MVPLVFLAIVAPLAAGLIALRVERNRRQRADRATADEATVDRFRELGMDAALPLLRRASTQAAPIRAEREHLVQDSIPVAEARQATARRHTWHEGRWGAPTVVVVAVCTVAWLYLFALLRALDVMVLIELGYAPAAANALGTLVAILTSVIGVLIAVIAGFHRLPAVERLRLPVRAVIAVVLVQAAVALLWNLPSIAESRSMRSPELGGRVSALTKVVADLQNDPSGDPVELAAAQADLNDAQERLDRARRLDRVVAIAVPVGEMALSSAPLLAIEFVLVGCAAATVAGRKRTVRILDRRLAGVSDAVLDRIADAADRAGIPPNEVEDWIAGHTRPAGGPGGGDGGGEGGTSSSNGGGADQGTADGAGTDASDGGDAVGGDGAPSANGSHRRRRSRRAPAEEPSTAAPGATSDPPPADDAPSDAAGWDELATTPPNRNHQPEDPE